MVWELNFNALKIETQVHFEKKYNVLDKKLTWFMKGS